MGLRIMRYRANTIGAELEIKALGRSGTIVSCTLPTKNRSLNNIRSTPRPARPVLPEGLNDLKVQASAPGVVRL
jgi:hypothetical protein